MGIDGSALHPQAHSPKRTQTITFTECQDWRSECAGSRSTIGGIKGDVGSPANGEFADMLETGVLGEALTDVNAETEMKHTAT
jgi:hypothetical protein